MAHVTVCFIRLSNIPTPVVAFDCFCICFAAYYITVLHLYCKLK